MGAVQCVRRSKLCCTPKPNVALQGIARIVTHFAGARAAPILAALSFDVRRRFAPPNELVVSALPSFSLKEAQSAAELAMEPPRRRGL